MKFYTRPRLHVKLMGTCSRTMVWKAARTVVAPHLSRNMVSIPEAAYTHIYLT